jgi:hypothetical protein
VYVEQSASLRADDSVGRRHHAPVHVVEVSPCRGKHLDLTLMEQSARDPVLYVLGTVLPAFGAVS